MAFVVGINIFISLRLAGFAGSIPLQPLQKFYPLHWISVVLIVLSGIALLIAYPAKALTNPVFYIKLLALTVALMLSRYFQLLIARNMLAPNAPKTIARLAVITLLLWIITITAGRFLAYTYNVLLASRFY